MSPPALPLELWLDVLAQLDYFTLLDVGTLNRSFHALVRHPALDVVGLRRHPKTGQKRSSQTCCKHPFLSTISWLGPNEDGELSVLLRSSETTGSSTCARNDGDATRRRRPPMPLALLPAADEIAVLNRATSWLPVRYLAGGPEVRFGVHQARTVGHALETIYAAARTHAEAEVVKGLVVTHTVTRPAMAVEWGCATVRRAGRDQLVLHM